MLTAWHERAKIPEPPKLEEWEMRVLSLRSEASALCGGNVLRMLDEMGIESPELRRDFCRGVLAACRGEGEADADAEKRRKGR